MRLFKLVKNGLRALFITMLIAQNPVYADDRALLIGVGEYKNSKANLPGIDLDIEAMQEVAHHMGFEPGQIKVLKNSQVTVSNIRKTMGSWLVNGVGKDDRVLVYYSGHGSRVADNNGDEDDGYDEVLTMYDVKTSGNGDTKFLDGILVDDDLNSFLNKIPSSNLYVMIDACHSGTATKGISGLDLSPKAFGEVDAFVKFFPNENLLNSQGKFIARSLTRDKDNKDDIQSSDIAAAQGVPAASNVPDDFLTLSAASDEQMSIATSKGSVFTMGLQKVFRDTSQSGKALTPVEITKHTQQFIDNHIPPAKRFNPQVTGSERLKRQPIAMRNTAAGEGAVVAIVGDSHGPVWSKMTALVNNANPMSVSINQAMYKVDDELRISIDVPFDGCLNIININAHDEATVLFPNRHVQNCKVTAGKFELPLSAMPFVIKATAPLGPSLVVAVVSEKKMNMFEDGVGNRNRQGVIEDVFATVSNLSLRSFRIAKKEQSNNAANKTMAAGQIETSVSSR